jgi:hypothetical protein
MEIVGAELIDADRRTDEVPHIISVEGRTFGDLLSVATRKSTYYLNARCLKPYTTFTTYGFFLRHFCNSLFSISSPVALRPIAGHGLLILEVS